MSKKIKILTIVGPTASGKSDLAVRLAQKFNGEIISADSRQVYKGLDIGSGKITKQEMAGIPHHLLDVARPRQTFTVWQFKTKADKAIKQIKTRGHLPIIAGGTGFYIQAVIDNLVLPAVPPDQDLRRRLKQTDLNQLRQELAELDPDRLAAIDQKNPRRLIRAIEIAKTLGQVPTVKTDPPYDVLIIGLDIDRDILIKKIKQRLNRRLQAGLIDEVKNLNRPKTGQGLTWRRLEDLGLEYRYIAQYLQGKLSKPEMIDQLTIAIGQYAKRQMTWFGKDKRIRWIKSQAQADRLIWQWLENTSGSTRT